ncbi:MAG: hypothetical protein N3F66_10205 [Spirochaetes bacterium]|nr:hypothetical protein [Spirochaetota bacterium]
MKNNYVIQTWLILLLTMQSFCYSTIVFAKDFSGYATVGLETAYCIIAGHYAESLNNGMGAGFFSFVPISDWFMVNGTLTYNRFSLTRSTNSNMQVFGISIVPSLYYTLPYDFTAYTGAGFSLKYHTLSAIKTEKSDATTKTGFVLHTGVSKNIFTRTIMAVECAYSLSELSHKIFQTIIISVKAGYQFALYSPDYYAAKEKEKAEQIKITIQQQFKRGVDHLKEKNASQALEYFNQVLSLDHNHKESLEYVSIITVALQQYNKAQSLIEINKDYEALPLLNFSSQYVKEAELLYKQLQKKLLPKVPDMITKGIEAFNNKNYDDCILIMNSVLYIDPNNTIASAYIVRAKRIKETIQKLQ